MRLGNKMPLVVLIFCVSLFANRINGQKKDTTRVSEGFIIKCPVTPPQTEVVNTTYDEAPIPPGGADGYKSYLEKNVVIPDSFLQVDGDATVYVSIIVEKNGSLSDIHIEKDNIHHGCGTEAIRVIKKMPPWTPGKIKGEAVRIRYVIPVRFKL